VIALPGTELCEGRKKIEKIKKVKHTS